MRWGQESSKSEVLSDERVGDGFVDGCEVSDRVGDDDGLERDTGDEVVADHVVGEVVLWGGREEGGKRREGSELGDGGAERKEIGREREKGGTYEDLHTHEVARLVDNLVPIENGFVDDLDGSLVTVFLRHFDLLLSKLGRDLDDSVAAMVHSSRQSERRDQHRFQETRRRV